MNIANCQKLVQMLLWIHDTITIEKGKNSSRKRCFYGFMTPSPLKKGKTLAGKDGSGYLSPGRANGVLFIFICDFVFPPFPLLHNSPSLQNYLKRKVAEC